MKQADAGKPGQGNLSPGLEGRWIFYYALFMQSVKPKRSLVFIIFANMIILGFLNSMRGVSFPLIKNNFGVSYNNMGLLGALLSFSAVFFCIVSSIFMNRFGIKKTIIAASMLVIAGAGSLFFASFFLVTVVFFIILQAGFGFFEISLNGSGVKFFTVKSGLMLNLLHFFYGVGAIAGPRFMGFMVNHQNLNWQEVYPLTLVPAFIMLFITLSVRFPQGNPVPQPHAEDSKTQSPSKVPSFWDMLKNPMVWLFGITIGLAGGMEGCSVSWSGLYLQDVYGLDPTVTGAAFLSLFYILYTASRFISGFIMEKTGYMRSTIVSGFAIIILFTAGFGLGRNGIYVLPVAGFFIAIMWPTVLAISAGFFREHAQTASSAMICIAFSLGGLIQYSSGLLNRFLGAAWGYRSCILYSLILVILLLAVRRKTHVAT